MHFSKLGLINSNDIFSDAIKKQYAIPAFNVYNLETIKSVLIAAKTAHSPVILAVSESALQYIGEENLIGIISAQKLSPKDSVILHLDHGSSFDICKHAIEIGFSSVMIDASKLTLPDNITITKYVSDFAHKYQISVEAEIGILSGIEDEKTFSDTSCYTNPQEAKKFVNACNIDSLAVAIGTSHGAYKRKSDNEKLRFDILQEIEKQIQKTPIVLHGASTIPQRYINTINKFGGQINKAIGIDNEQLKFASTKTHICKINIDSDLRLATTAAIRQFLANNPEKFNPRDYLTEAQNAVCNHCLFLMREIMCCENKLQQ